MKYKIEFELECPESDDDGDLIDPSTYDKDTIYNVAHAALWDEGWKLKNFKIKYN